MCLCSDIGGSYITGILKAIAIVWVGGARMSLDYFISLYWIFSGLSHLLIFPSGRIRKENLGRIHLTH